MRGGFVVRHPQCEFRSGHLLKAAQKTVAPAEVLTDLPCPAETLPTGGQTTLPIVILCTCTTAILTSYPNHHNIPFSTHFISNIGTIKIRALNKSTTARLTAVAAWVCALINNTYRNPFFCFICHTPRLLKQSIYLSHAAFGYLVRAPQLILRRRESINLSLGGIELR